VKRELSCSNRNIFLLFRAYLFFSIPYSSKSTTPPPTTQGQSVSSATFLGWNWQPGSLCNDRGSSCASDNCSGPW